MKVGTLLRALGRRDGTDTPRQPPLPHSFREKALRRGGPCAACGETLGPQGLVCRVCKVTSHRRCEAKVTSPCQAPPPPELRRNTVPARRSEPLGSTKSLNSPRQRNTLPRTLSLEQLLLRDFAFDLSYVTERIIALRFPAALEEPRYRGHLREVAQMLASRHGQQYMVFNLSEKRRDITRLNPKVQEFGWPDLHAPPLDKLCSICKAMEGWLGGHPRNVAVLHCKGSSGKAGVVVAAYMHYSKVSASADEALGTLTMRKFCEEKVGAALQPSQRRYITYFSSLLSGSARLSPSPRFLHHVLLPPLPGSQPFLKIYQSMQLVYTSGVYSISSPPPQSLCITLEPALLLKGDVMVKCYQRGGPGGRRALFRVQFHTGTLRGSHLELPKGELDQACGDDRFPPGGTVELVFSCGPERVEGWDPPHSPPAVPIDYGLGDPAVRRDSYEGLGLRHEDSEEELPPARGPLDGSPYARVQKRRGPEAWTPGGAPDTPDHPTSGSSGPEPPPGRPPPPTAAERQELERLLGGFGVRGPPPGERETPILEDDPPHPTPHGTLTPYGTPAPYGAAAAYGTLTPHGTPTSHGTPISYGSPTSHGTPISHGTPTPYGTPTSHGSPTSHETPTSYGSPMSYGTTTPHGTTAPYGTLTPHGTPTPQETPTSYGTPISYGSPTSYGTPTPYGTPTSHRSPTPHGTPISYGSPTPYGTPTTYSPPAPPLCRRASLAPPCPCRPPEGPRYGAEGSLEQRPGGPGGGLEGPGGPQKRGVQRSLSEGFPPPGYGRRGGGYLLLGELPPQCPCLDCQGWGAQPPPPLYGMRVERGGDTWGSPPRPPTPGQALEPPPASCPHCGRPGFGGGGRAPARTPTAPRDPYGKMGYDPPGLEAREGYGIPGQPDPQEPPEHRSPGEGGPWRGTPEGPNSLLRPPRELGYSPDPPSPSRRILTEPPQPRTSPPPPPAGSSPHGCSGGGPGSPTPAFPPPSAYSQPPSPQPPLPEKRHPPAPGGPRDPTSPPHHVSFLGGGTHGCQDPPPEGGAPAGVTFVQDTSKFWYKPGLSREQAVALLKGRDPGTFLIRRSSNFPGAFGLALRVATAPPRAGPPKGDPQEQLVRHFLIETGPRGVKIKGSPDEPHFGSLPALVLQHSITPLSLPCTLRIPSQDLLEEGPEVPVPPNVSTAGDLLRQGAACRVLFLGSVGTESLTGPQAVAKAAGTLLGDPPCAPPAGTTALGGPPRGPPCTVHFKVSEQGITLTDSQRKLFFRRHYPVSNVTFCSTDPQGRRWQNPDGSTSEIFGFVAKQGGGGGGNTCHLFAELDPEQPAPAIVTFVTKVLLGTHRH